MVNCKNCGAPLTLEDAVCPHCGTPNPEAQEHLKKLAQLDKDYRKARKEVISEVRKTKKGYNLLIILVMLLLANLALIPFHAASYEIAHQILARSMDIQEVKAHMDELLEEKEYFEFIGFYDRFETNYRDFEDYYPLYYQANNYSYVARSMSSYLYEKDPYEDPLVRACQYVKRYAEDYGYQKKREMSDFTKKHMEAINSEYEQYLKTFLKLSEEEISAIEDMSNSELVILATRRLNDEE